MMWYKCPICRGEFSWWGSWYGAGSTNPVLRCPFCFTEQGKYPQSAMREVLHLTASWMVGAGLDKEGEGKRVYEAIRSILDKE
jgi:hypothetical protein